MSLGSEWSARRPPKKRATRFAPGGARSGLAGVGACVEGRSPSVSSSAGARGVWVRPWVEGWLLFCRWPNVPRWSGFGELASRGRWGLSEVRDVSSLCAWRRSLGGGTCPKFWSRTVVNPPRRPGGRHSPLLGERQDSALGATEGGLCADLPDPSDWCGRIRGWASPGGDSVARSSP